MNIFLKILGKVAWIFVGIILAATLGEPIRQIKERLREPERVLAEAKEERMSFTAIGLNRAGQKYDSLLDRAPNLRAQALWGISKTYADLATHRRWRGVSPRDYRDLARSYALQALDVAPDDPQTGVALAYAYESTEATQQNKSATRAKILELLAQGIDTPDIQYLAWVSKATEKARSYPDALRPQGLSDLRILLHVGMHFIELARAKSGNERDAALQSADEFLLGANNLSSDNALVLFARGYLAGERGKITEAHEYFAKALDKQKDFPTARNNFGYTYGAIGDWENARKHFEEAALTPSAPGPRQRIYLDNLASASLEVGDNTKACKAWRQASEIPGANEKEQAFVFVGFAICSYVMGQEPAAILNYRRAIELGRGQKVDLTNISTFEESKVGPRELEVTRALIQLTTK